MTETLLIVDAKPASLELLSKVLNDFGYAYCSAVNENEMLRHVEKCIPNLILINAEQKNGSGIELCELLKSNADYRKIPIILFDEKSKQFNKSKAFEIGVVDIIDFPFEKSELISKVKSQINLFRLEQQKLEVESKFSRLEKLAQAGNWEWDLITNKVTWSEQLYDIYEVDKATFTPTKEAALERIHEDHREHVLEIVTAAKEEQGSFSYEADIIYPNGLIKRLITWGEVKVNEEGEPSEMIGVSMLVSKEMTDRRILGRITDMSSIVGGIEYFDTICNFLTVNLSIDYAFVGEYIPETHSMRSLSFSNNGKILDGIEYKLDNSPCDNVLGKEMCYYIKDSQKLFPLDEDLVTLEVEGYVGVPLFDGETPLGIIVLLSKSPLNDSDTDKTSIQGLVKRTETEIIRYKKDRDIEIHLKNAEDYISKSDAKKAELALVESEERLSLATKAGGIGIWDWDVKNNILTWGDSMYELYDLGRGGFSGAYEAWKETLHPDDVLNTEEAVRLALSGEKEFDTEFRIIGKKGSVKYINAKGKVYFEGGEAIRMVGANTDITELINAKERLKTYLKKVTDSNQDLESFAYIASHDLQEPLRVITSYLQLIESRYKDKLDDKGKDFIERVIGATGRMKLLINELLEFSRIESGGSEFLEIDSNELVALSLKDLEIAIEKSNAKITVDKLLTIIGDKAQVQRVFLNLISNAIKYRNPDVDPIIKISAIKKGELAEFCIEDNGIGIEEEYHERIFEIFQRLHTRDEYVGTGLGLAITKKIIKRHGGNIGLKSKINKGTTITFTLPLKSDW